MKTYVIGDVHGRFVQLRNLVEVLPHDASSRSLVLLGDLIDRGADAPGVVSYVIKLQRENPDRVVCLRGNHEQMMLDCVDQKSTFWLTPVTGGEKTFEQYTGAPLRVETEADFDHARRKIVECVPPDHMNFLRGLPFYHEDDYALYVHAGLDKNKHPRDTAPLNLLWARSKDFYTQYRGKPCLFGHTPTNFLPLRGRLGRHGIYIFHSAIGIDTGYNQNSPLSCLSLPDFTLYQAFADGRTTTHRITAFIPDTLRAMQKRAASKIASNMA